MKKNSRIKAPRSLQDWFFGERVSLAFPCNLRSLWRSKVSIETRSWDRSSTMLMIIRTEWGTQRVLWGVRNIHSYRRMDREASIPGEFPRPEWERMDGGIDDQNLRLCWSWNMGKTLEPENLGNNYLLIAHRNTTTINYPKAPKSALTICCSLRQSVIDLLCSTTSRTKVNSLNL